MTTTSLLTNFPNGITSFGLPVVGNGTIPISNQNYWFVSSTLGSNGNDGTTPATAFATLAYATQIASLKASDTIVILEGHAETVTAAGTTTTGILASTNGVNIVGYGTGTLTPTFTFTTATTASFKVTGTGTVIQGCRFVTGINSLATCLDIQATGVVVTGCTFNDDGTHTGLSFINLVGASANASDGLKILGNYFYNKTSGNFNHAIGLTTVQDNVEIGGNYIVGTWALSGIHNITGKVLTNINVHDNYVRNLTAATPALNFISATTGVAYRNNLEGGDSTCNSAKFGTALNAEGGNVGIGGSLDAGAEFWYVKKGIVCSTIVTAGIAISAASIGGELAIKNIITKTDPSTGLAGFTTFKITTNNVNGALIVMQTTNIGTSATTSMVPLDTGTTATSNATVLELGKVINIVPLTTAGSGAGTVDVYVLLQRLTGGADLSAV